MLLGCNWQHSHSENRDCVRDQHNQTLFGKLSYSLSHPASRPKPLDSFLVSSLTLTLFQDQNHQTLYGKFSHAYPVSRPLPLDSFWQVLSLLPCFKTITTRLFLLSYLPLTLFQDQTKRLFLVSVSHSSCFSKFSRAKPLLIRQYREKAC